MEQFNPENLKKLYIPAQGSHKGQNGKLMLIGGSHLFHAASLWSLQIASRIVDMVFYSSVAENNLIVEELKKEFRNGIIVRRDDMENYIEEADAILIGPGMLRTERKEEIKRKEYSLEEINQLADEGEQSYYLTKYLLGKYPHKKWVIDAGALQMLEPEWLPQLKGNVVLTPHPLEFERVFGRELKIQNSNQIESGSKVDKNFVEEMAKKYNCTILVKGKEDMVCSAEQCIEISGGNAGMTKGGTGDVLAGLVAALACKNDLYLAATAGSYINKKAGELLFERVGYYFNASDLANEIPQAMMQLLL
ncbi:MAG TPA: NAD(P)H-hydrate dehydratase [Patescibacteria group bacterium]